MSDILIRGMELPKNEPLRIVLNPNGQLFVDHGVTFTEYEAVELPEHGDLIDRDAFDADARKRYCSACDNYNGTKCRACWVDDMLGDVADFETVIPSNKEESE